MVFSPFRSAISHAPRRKPTADDPYDIAHRPRGSNLPYSDAKVLQVRRLIETTLFSYSEIAKRTGVPLPTVGRWTLNGQWLRPLFAPRAPDTVPSWRAGRRRKRRMLSARLCALAERYIRELEAAPAVKVAKLREALELLKMTKLAEHRHNLSHRPVKAVPPLADPQARARDRGPARERRRHRPRAR